MSFDQALCGVDETPHGGDIVASTTPTTPTPWKVQFADGNFNTLFGVSCPAPSLCVAVDDNHRVFTSSHPSGGKSAWSTQSIDFRWSLLNVSCSSKGLCVTGDQGGNVVVGQLPPPNTQITNAAISKSNRAATFKFKALGLSSGFQCALHKKAVKAKSSPCGSPKSYTNLSRGRTRLRSGPSIWRAATRAPRAIRSRSSHRRA